MSTYDISKPTNYLKRKMFLDGEVTVQRYEEFRQPKIAKYEELQRGFFWVPEEISLTKDKMDHKDATPAIKHIFTSNLLRQTALDSIQGRAPVQIFSPVISIPELESLVLIWSMFETNIHSKSYSHIIRNVYSVPKEEFNKIHDTREIVDMAANIGRHYDALHDLNCRRAMGQDISMHDHKRAIWLALHASYALEAFRFMVSFATSLAMVENKIYIGNGTSSV
jgi:ribonucleoside-diphosphate reductase beta chain